MEALSVLYGGNLAASAFEKVFDGQDAFSLTLKRAALLGDAHKILLLVNDDFDEKRLPDVPGIELVRAAAWDVQSMLDALARVSGDYNVVYFAHADCPFLDPDLTNMLTWRHFKHEADYSYADGWPEGLAPELLAPGTAAVLARLNGGQAAPVTRGTLFSVLQKDINSFDIETELSRVDLRQHRISICADSKRNLLLVRRIWDALRAPTKFPVQVAKQPQLPATPPSLPVEAISQLVVKEPAFLRTLPAFFPVQVTSACPQTCVICPYPTSALASRAPETVMPLDKFKILLQKIVDFADDGVIDLSLWGEIALHPQKMDLFRAVLERDSLNLVIETSGIGWKTGELEALAAEAARYKPRKNGMAALSLIVSLDGIDYASYQKTRGGHEALFNEALACAKNIAALFGENAYIQTVRCKGSELQTEQFYRFWTDDASGPQVIIQKYDHFCGRLPDLRATDLSPVRREPCWHIMRDMPVFVDGSAPVCREILDGKAAGNVFAEDLDAIWQRGQAIYAEHCAGNYASCLGGLCEKCDEYWTFNF